MSGKLIYTAFLFALISGCKSGSEHDSHVTQEGHENMSGMNHTTHSDSTFNHLTDPTNKVVVSNAETIYAVNRKINDTIHLTGYITFDARRNNIVSVRSAGRIEKLYIKVDYQNVRKGDKVLELYSPELNTYIDEYRHHLTTQSDSSLISATRQKLLYMGLSESQVKSIESGNMETNTVTVVSPYDGIVIFSQDNPVGPVQAQNNSSTDGMSGMGSAGRQSTAVDVSSGSRIREGEYVSKGQMLFTVNDCKTVNGIFSFSPQQSHILKEGLPIRVQSPLISNKEIDGKIDFIEPVFKEGQKFIHARVYLMNESLKLKINSVASGDVILSSSGIVVPTSSILHLGNRTFVWMVTEIDNNGVKKLSAKQVSLGSTFNGNVQILSGITEHEQIARDAAYLLDSESLIDNK